jgi:hypothetical protein
MATEPSCVAPHRELHRLFADLARLALVDVAHAADEAALQVAEGVAAHALDAQLALISSHSRSASAPLPESCTLPCASCSEVLGQLRQHRLAGGVVDAFADRDHAAAVAVVGGLHVGQELSISNTRSGR